MAWIEVHQELRGHYKVARLARYLCVSRNEATGMLVNLWLWSSIYAPKGDLSEFTSEQIDEACCFERTAITPDIPVIAAMEQSGLLDCRYGKKSIHDWKKHGMRLFNSRNKRVKEFRERGGGDPKKWIATRVRVLQRDDYKCAYCGKKANTVDHVIPSSQHGGNDDENLVAACKKCNLSKNNRTPQEAGMAIRYGALSNITQWHSVTPTIPNHTIPNHTIPNQTIPTTEEQEPLAPHVDPVQEAFDYWNDEAAVMQIPTAKKLTDKRVKSIKARLQETEFSLQQIFAEIRQSAFLLGKNNRGWKVHFDFVFLSTENYVKILEGNYRNGNTKDYRSFNARTVSGPGGATGIDEVKDTFRGTPVR